MGEGYKVTDKAQPVVRKAEFSPVTPVPSLAPAKTPMEVLGDLVLDLTLELSRIKVLIRDVLEWQAGTVISLEKAAGEPVEVLVNGYPLGTGEIVVVNDRMGVCLRAFKEGRN